MVERIRMKRALQAHQIERLKDTHADFLHSETHRQLAIFFFNDIYHVGDFQARNESYLKLYQHCRLILGTRLIKGLSDLIDLYLLSERLDDAVTDVLLKMKVPLDFSRPDYDRAYRYADNYPDRLLQLEHLSSSISFVHALSQRRLIGTLLRAVQGTARLIGATPMIDFLHRGYVAYRSVPDIREFNDTVRARELARLDRIYREIPLDWRYTLDRDGRRT